MDEKSITPFDELITPPMLQIIKLFIPYIPPKQQKTLAVYEKYLELQCALNFFQNNHNILHIQSSNNETLPFSTILEKIKPYLSKQEQESFDSISNAMSMMELFKEFQEMEGPDYGGMDEPSNSKENESSKTTVD